MIRNESNIRDGIFFSFFRTKMIESHVFVFNGHFVKKVCILTRHRHFVGRLTHYWLCDSYLFNTLLLFTVDGIRNVINFRGLAIISRLLVDTTSKYLELDLIDWMFTILALGISWPRFSCGLWWFWCLYLKLHLKVFDDWPRAIGPKLLSFIGHLGVSNLALIA